MRAGIPVSHLFVASGFALVACSPGTDAAKTDPNRPAVVQAPPVVLPSDTAKPDTMPAYRERMEAAQRELATDYAMISATAILQDARTLAGEYAPDAVLKLGGSTYTGQAQVVNALIEFMRRSSVKDLQRRSYSLNAVDSVYTDSGVYAMLSQRTGGAPVEERGTYVSVWRLRSGTPRWELRRDEIMPAAPAKKR